MEILIIGLILFVILEANNVVSGNRFVKDNEKYFDLLKEKDYEFYLRSKYGDQINSQVLFMKRVKLAFAVMIVFFFMFITNLNYVNIGLTLIVGFLIYKMPYLQLKKYYKSHLREIDMLLPYYLKSLEILIQHYTVPVALGKSIDSAPDMFKPGLNELISKINAGDSTIDPYVAFANQYPVRDSMRMMRLLYRLSLGANEHKQEQLLIFARNVSSLQNKTREVKYKDRLRKMENKTMLMLVITGGGAMILMLISLVLTIAL